MNKFAFTILNYVSHFYQGGAHARNLVQVIAIIYSTNSIHIASRLMYVTPCKQLLINKMAVRYVWTSMSVCSGRRICRVIVRVDLVQGPGGWWSDTVLGP